MQLILVTNKAPFTKLRMTLHDWGSTSLLSARKTSTQHEPSTSINPPDPAPPTPELNSALTCPICLEPTHRVQTAPCDHSFCTTCYKTWFTAPQQPCPLCRHNHPPRRTSTAASSCKTSTSSASATSLNAIYNQALIDNYRIQRARLPRATKAQAKVLLAEMHAMERIPSHFAGKARSSVEVEDVERYLTDRQLEIARLLLEGRG